MKNALVIGGDSNLGQALCGQLQAGGWSVVRTSRRQPLPQADPPWIYCDLRQLHQIEALWASFGPKVVYIMAAVTGIMRCETDPHAWEINAEAPLLIAQKAQVRGWHPVFISSGTVERAPHTALARQKSYADQAVLLLGGCVVRPVPHVAPDQYDEVARLLVDVGEREQAGVVRWLGPGEVR